MAVRCALLFMLAALLTGCQGIAPRDPTAATATPPPGMAAALDALVQQQVKAGTFSGSVLVAHGDTILLRKGYGLANRELGVPNSPATEFRIGSLSKQFTAMAILMLEQRGKLHVQDPVCAYVPNCPAAWRPMTIHHLLTHESGLPASPTDEDVVLAQTQRWSPTQWLPHIEASALAFPPGTKYSYGNLNYMVLAAIVERVSGQSYLDFLRANIFAPLDLQHTGQDPAGFAAYSLLPDRATGYVHAGGRIENEPYEDVSVYAGAGSLYSTVDDLYRWQQALGTEQLGPKAQLDQMFTPYLSNIGYGWEIGTLGSHRGEGAFGQLPGFRSAIERYPDDKVAVIILGNLDISQDAIAGLAQALSLAVFAGR